jgi:hypothetical protein
MGQFPFKNSEYGKSGGPDISAKFGQGHLGESPEAAAYAN